LQSKVYSRQRALNAGNSLALPALTKSFMPSEAINIGPRERTKRRLMGIVALTAGVGTAFVLVANGSPRLLRLIIFFPIWIAGLGLMQSREKT